MKSSEFRVQSSEPGGGLSLFTDGAQRSRRIGTVPTVIMFFLIACPVIAYCQPLPVEVKEKAGERVWKKDPFAPPPVTEAPAVGKEEIPALEVSAILYSGDRSAAVVNGKTVRIGDELYGQKVIDIKKGYVILGSGKKRYRLELRK